MRVTKTDIGGETVVLDADKALIWPSGSAIFVADTHFGKDASARVAGAAIPEGTTESDLTRLSSLIHRYHPRSIWILGDVFHSRDAREPRTLDQLRTWRDQWSDIDILMVPGNHDMRALKLADTIGIQIFPEPHHVGPWMLTHAPCAVEGGHGLCGHLHPAVRLAGPARQRITLPCFLSSRTQTILPAFGGMTGRAQIKPRPGDRVWPVSGGTIHGPFPIATKNSSNS